LNVRGSLPPVVFPVALLVSGCATVLSGTSQKVNVTTLPPGAACTMTRDGTVLGSIAATPGTLEIGKGSGYLRLTCTKQGYLDAEVTAVSHYNTSTLWNHAGFGIIGLGVDSASGAMYHYVPDVRVQMIDEEFDSEASRDATYYGIASIAEVEARGARVAVTKGCYSDCDASLRAFDAALAAKLAEIENKRRTAKVKQ
jgi:hypothetical protein